MTPDLLPLTGLPWADAAIKVIGAVGIICSFLATVLPKGLAVTQLLAKGFADLRGIVPAKAAAEGAEKEAAAQQVGLSTVGNPSLVVLPPIPNPPPGGAP